MIKPKKRKNVQTELTPRQRQTVDMAKRMMTMYVEDKFAGRIDIKEFHEVLDDIVINFGKTEQGLGGFHHPLTRLITISENEDEETAKKGKIELDKVGTIIHEVGHYLSFHCTEGNEISLFFEEGMADVFSEECINHFLRTVSKQEIADKLDYTKDIYGKGSDYKNEADFVRTTLEVLRQRKDNVRDIEFEYFFGNKDNIIKLCQEVFGEEYIEILKQQQIDGKDNLAKKGEVEYNIKLKNIVKEMEIELDGPIINSDGSVNICLAQNRIIESIKNEKEFSAGADELYNLAIKDGTLEGLIQLGEKYNGFLNEDLIEKLASSNVYSTVDIIKYICRFKYDDREIPGYMKLLDLGQLATEDFSKLGLEERKVILTGIMQEERYMEKYLPMVERIEESALAEKEKTGVELTREEQLLTLRCKYLCDFENKGEKLAQIFSLIKDEDILSLNDKEIDICRLVSRDFEEYLRQYAKNDLSGKEKIFEVFGSFEGKWDELDKTFVDPISIYYKDMYYKQIDQDMSSMSYVMVLDDNDFETLYHNPLTSKCHPKQGMTLSWLQQAQEYSVLLQPFSKENVSLVMQMTGIGDEFDELTDEHKSMVLDVLEETITRPEFTPQLERIVDYVGAMLTTDENEDIQKRKGGILQGISNKIKEGVPSIEGMYQLLYKHSGKFPASKQYILNVLNNELAQKIQSGEVIDATIDKITTIAAQTEQIGEAEQIKHTAMEALATLFDRKQLTTEGFLEASNVAYSEYEKSNTYVSYEESRCYYDILIQGYLQSIEAGNDLTQRKLLTHLINLSKGGMSISNPQYITYENLSGEEEQAIFLNGENGLRAYSSQAVVLEDNIELLKKQNKGKKGLFSLFKSEKAKEPISRTIVIDNVEKGKISKVINMYESGRIEIAELQLNGKKHKVIKKEDIELRDIGYNGGLIVTPEEHSFSDEIASQVRSDAEYVVIKPKKEKEEIGREEYQ